MVHNHIEIKLLDLAYRGLRLSIASSVLLAVLIVFALWTAVAKETLLSWFAAMLAIMFLRFQFLCPLQGVGNGCAFQPGSNTWKTGFIGSAAAAGLCWGSTVFIFPTMPHDPATLLVIFFIAGVTAFASVSMASVPSAANIFMICAVLPLAIWLFSFEKRLQTVLGLISLLYLGTMVMFSRQSYRSLCSLISLEATLVEREQEFRSLAENLPDNIVRFNREGAAQYFNPVLERTLGKLAAVMLGKTPREYHPDGTFEDYAQLLDKVIASGEAGELDKTLPGSNGETRVHHIRIVPECGVNGEVVGALTIGRDITELDAQRKRVQAHDAMLEMVARGALLTDILNAIVRQVESEDKYALCSILLLDAEGKHLLNGAAPSLPAFYNQAIHGIEIGPGVGSCGTAAYLGQRVIVEDIMTHEYWKPYCPLAQQAGLRSCWSEPILSSQGRVLGTFAIYHTEPLSPQAGDLERISFAVNLAALAIENRSTHEELERRAYSDYLTGLANRRYFMEQAETEVARALRYGEVLSILMLDVDHFKQINDHHGHKVGDIVLQKLSAVCKTTVRAFDIVGRLGGEEFAVLFPKTGMAQALIAAEHLRVALAAAEVVLNNETTIHFTASLGVATLNREDAHIDTLLNRADKALYQAKNGGRNRVCEYQEAGEKSLPEIEESKTV